jgi:hypothetical protein
MSATRLTKQRRARDDVDDNNILPERTRPAADRSRTEKQKENGKIAIIIAFSLNSHHTSADENANLHELERLRKEVRKLKKVSCPARCRSSLPCSLIFSLTVFGQLLMKMTMAQSLRAKKKMNTQLLRSHHQYVLNHSSIDHLLQVFFLRSSLSEPSHPLQHHTRTFAVMVFRVDPP